jgi:putative membrane protein
MVRIQRILYPVVCRIAATAARERDAQRKLHVKTQETSPAKEPAAVRTDLATTRSFLAADRTLLAWLRMAVSMLSFAFAIYKIPEGFQSAGRLLPSANTTRNVGLFLAAMGTLAMVMGTAEYLQTFRSFGTIKPMPLARLSLVMAMVMTVIGISLFVGILAGAF